MNDGQTLESRRQEVVVVAPDSEQRRISDLEEEGSATIPKWRSGDRSGILNAVIGGQATSLPDLEISMQDRDGVLVAFSAQRGQNREIFDVYNVATLLSMSVFATSIR